MGRGRQTEGDLHSICQGLQWSGQKRAEIVCAWTKVRPCPGPEHGKLMVNTSHSLPQSSSLSVFSTNIKNIQSYRNDNLNFLFCSDLSNDNSYNAPPCNVPQRNLFLKLSILVYLVDQKKMNIFFNHFTYFFNGEKQMFAGLLF